MISLTEFGRKYYCINPIPLSHILSTSGILTIGKMSKLEALATSKKKQNTNQNPEGMALIKDPITNGEIPKLEALATIKKEKLPSDNFSFYIQLLIV